MFDAFTSTMKQVTCCNSESQRTWTHHIIWLCSFLHVINNILSAVSKWSNRHYTEVVTLSLVKLKFDWLMSIQLLIHKLHTNQTNCSEAQLKGYLAALIAYLHTLPSMHWASYSPEILLSVWYKKASWQRLFCVFFYVSLRRQIVFSLWSKVKQGKPRWRQVCDSDTSCLRRLSDRDDTEEQCSWAHCINCSNNNRCHEGKRKVLTQ